MISQVCIIFILIGAVHGTARCVNDTHGILRYKGLPCASVRLYTENHKGACGCGPSDVDAPFSWNLADFVVAPNLKYFDDGGDKQYCGHNCGHCVKLTPTGGMGVGQGAPPVNSSPHIFMITNVCTSTDSPEWCGQAGKPGTNHANQHGNEVHFHLQNHRGQVSVGLGWNNPEVTWEPVVCPQQFVTKWHQCSCYSNASG